MPRIDFQKVLSNFSEDYAIFSSSLELASFLTQMNELSENEKEDLAIGFKHRTLDIAIEEAYDYLSNIKDENDFRQFITENTHLFEIVRNEDGEEEVVEKNRTLHKARFLLNEDMIIKVGDSFEKYMGDYCIYSNDYSKLTSIESEADLFLSELKYRKVIKHLSNSYRNGLNSIYTYEEENDQDKCKNDRKIILEVQLFHHEIWFEVGPGEWAVIIEIWRRAECFAKRKGIFCIWYGYNTNITWNDFDMRYYDHEGTLIYWSESNTICYSCKKILYLDLIHSYTGPELVSYEWEKHKSKLTTTGMGGIWLDVDETF